MYRGETIPKPSHNLQPHSQKNYHNGSNYNQVPCQPAAVFKHIILWQQLRTYSTRHVFNLIYEKITKNVLSWSHELNEVHRAF